MIRNHRYANSSLPPGFSLLPALLLLSSLLVAGGCGGTTDTVPVSGKVSYRGEPLSSGMVMFIPEDSGPAATGDIQPDGTFKVTTHKKDDGAVPGKYKVTVQVFPDPAEGGGLPGMEFGGEKPPIPVKYGSALDTDLRVVVNEGENDFDLQLTD